jgi:imidazolonepropionase-like amidohydrolase
LPNLPNLVYEPKEAAHWPKALDPGDYTAARAVARAADAGAICVGKRADLLLLRDNPLESVSAYDSIETIFLNREPIPREALRAHE